MHDSDLKQLWQEQSFASAPALPDDRQLAAMKQKMRSLDHSIRWGDFWELAACIVCVFLFGTGYLLGDDEPLVRLGCLVLVFSGVFIGWRILRNRLLLPKAESNAPVFETIKVELIKVETQICLLKSGLTLHILPLFIGLTLVGWGGSSSMSEKLVNLIQGAIACGMVFCLNRFTIKNKFQPIKAELEYLLNPSENVPTPKIKSPRSYFMWKLMIIIIAAVVFWVVGLMATTNSEAPVTKPSIPAL